MHKTLLCAFFHAEQNIKISCVCGKKKNWQTHHKISGRWLQHQKWSSFQKRATEVKARLTLAPGQQAPVSRKEERGGLWRFWQRFPVTTCANAAQSPLGKTCMIGVLKILAHRNGISTNTDSLKKCKTDTKSSEGSPFRAQPVSKSNVLRQPAMLYRMDVLYTRMLSKKMRTRPVKDAVHWEEARVDRRVEPLATFGLRNFSVGYLAKWFVRPSRFQLQKINRPQARCWEWVQNMLSQESQKMCFECSVAIKCELLKNFKIKYSKFTNLNWNQNC